MENKHNTCVIAGKLDFISSCCNELYTMIDSLKLQAVLASDQRIKDRFDKFAEDLMHITFTIKSLADTSIRDIENFEVREDVFSDNGMEGY